jgi:hypothetical protein
MMIHLDKTLLKILKDHSITVKLEIFDPHSKIQHVRINLKHTNKILSIRLWKFDTWFLLAGIKNLYDRGGWNEESFHSTMESIIDYEMHLNPESIAGLLPYMSERLKIKYTSNITGLRFDL